MEIALAIVAALVSVAGVIFSSTGTSNTNKSNQNIASNQNTWNLEQWNRENQYNIPANQMARYTAAGLNPNLIYGQSNYSATSPRASDYSFQNPMQALQGLNLSGVSDAFTRKRKADIGQQNADTAAAGQKAAAIVQNENANLAKENTRGKKLENEVLEYALEDKKQEQWLKNQALVEGINLSKGKLSGINKQIELDDKRIAQYDREYDIAMKRLSMDVEKHPWLLKKLQKEDALLVYKLALEEELQGHRISWAKRGLTDKDPLSLRLGSDVLDSPAVGGVKSFIEKGSPTAKNLSDVLFLLESLGYYNKSN